MTGRNSASGIQRLKDRRSTEENPQFNYNYPRILGLMLIMQAVLCVTWLMTGGGLLWKMTVAVWSCLWVVHLVKSTASPQVRANLNHIVDYMMYFAVSLFALQLLGHTLLLPLIAVLWAVGIEI